MYMRVYILYEVLPSLFMSPPLINEQFAGCNETLYAQIIIMFIKEGRINKNK